jgi:hypothetical protein
VLCSLSLSLFPTHKCTQKRTFPSAMFALTNQPVAAWKAFPASESAEAVAEYRALPVANPRDIVHIENGVWDAYAECFAQDPPDRKTQRCARVTRPAQAKSTQVDRGTELQAVKGWKKARQQNQ